MRGVVLLIFSIIDLRPGFLATHSKANEPRWLWVIGPIQLASDEPGVTDAVAFGFSMLNCSQYD
jgi:hypothetical protein